MFPTPLTTKATPRVAMASPFAPRAVEESCEVRAATPVNATPTAAMAAPAANELAAGSPLAIIARPSRGASTTFAASATVMAAASARGRPDDPRAEQLVAAPLFALPRVPDDGEHAHHRGQDRERQVAPAHRVGADTLTRGVSPHRPGFAARVAAHPASARPLAAVRRAAAAPPRPSVSPVREGPGPS